MKPKGNSEQDEATRLEIWLEMLAEELHRGKLGEVKYSDEDGKLVVRFQIITEKATLEGLLTL